MSDPTEPWAVERRVQAAGRACLARTVADLEAGMTEAELAGRLRAHARDLGARGFFHQPLVWFGDRTRISGSRLKTLPGDRRLTEGDAVVLDAAPNFEGVPADVSLTASLGANPAVERGRRALAELRELIPDRVTSGSTARDLAIWVRGWIEERGMRSCQEGYLFHALGHRVYRTPSVPLAAASVGGLGAFAALRLFSTAALAWVPGSPVGWPFWNESRAADRPPRPGLWSVEPHLAVDGVGCKWEELLVIDEAGGARWLEPNSPLS